MWTSLSIYSTQKSSNELQMRALPFIGNKKQKYSDIYYIFYYKTILNADRCDPAMGTDNPAMCTDNADRCDQHISHLQTMLSDVPTSQIRTKLPRSNSSCSYGIKVN